MTFLWDGDPALMRPAIHQSLAHLPAALGRFVEGVLCLAGLLLCIASLVSSSYNPFLYFRF